MTVSQGIHVGVVTLVIVLVLAMVFVVLAGSGLRSGGHTGRVPGAVVFGKGGKWALVNL